MANVHDVVAYLIKRKGSIPSIKLQKLLYYSQAWSLVWDERPMFHSRIEAWANGPVVPEVYRVYRKLYKVNSAVRGDTSRLKPREVSTIDAVLDAYGNKDSFWLSELTHRESPWIEARKGVAPGEPSDNEITQASMAEYYGGLV